MKKCIIKADYNDGDYISQSSEITEDEIPILRKIASVIKGKYGDWPTVDCSDNYHNPTKLYVNSGLLTSEEVYFFEDLLPYGEYGIHTIESIEIVEFLEKLY